MKLKVGVITGLLLAYIVSGTLALAAPVLASTETASTEQAPRPAAASAAHIYEQFAGHFKLAVDDSTNDSCAEQTSGLAWVICPTIRALNDIVFKLYNDVVRPLLFVKPFNQSNDNSVKQVWAAFRTLANALFVLAFLYIIFANVFSYNMNVYTVRRMLPRLVAAVIMVQFSFLIASLIVDIGNILGIGIQDFVSSVIKGLGKQDKDNNLIVNVVTGLNYLFSTILASLLIGSAVVTFGIGVSLLAAAGAIIGLLAAVVTLIIRQLLISTLIVLSPIAFVAWVLPNTEKWFKFWWENLTKLVMMFPIISLLMSLGALFAVVSSSDNGKVATINQLAASLFPIVAFMLIPSTFAIAGRLFGSAGNFIGSRSGNAQRSLRGSQLRRNMQEDQKLKLANYEGQRGQKGFGGRLKSGRGYVAGAAQGRVFGRKGAGNEFRFQRTQSATTDEMAKRLAMDSSISTNDLVKFAKGDKDGNKLTGNITLDSMLGNASGTAAVHSMLAKKGLYDQDIVKALENDSSYTEEQKDSIFSHVKRTANAELMEENPVLGYIGSRRRKNSDGTYTKIFDANGQINSQAVEEGTRDLIATQTAKLTGQKLAKMSKEGFETLSSFKVGTDEEIANGTAKSAASFITASAIEGTSAPTVAAGMSDIQRGALYDIRHELDDSARLAVRMNYDDQEIKQDGKGRSLVSLRQQTQRDDIKKAAANPDSKFDAYRLRIHSEATNDQRLSTPKDAPSAPSAPSAGTIADDGGVVDPGVIDPDEDDNA